MRTSRMWSIMAIMLVISMLMVACGATPTATPVPPTPVPPTATKAPVPTNTAVPAAPTATTAPAAAAPTAVPPTATKPAPTNTAVPPTAVPPTAVAAPRKGGTLIIGAATMFPNLNPFNIPGGQWMKALRFARVRLINLDANNNYLPDLAKSWTISPDGTVYTFNLRTDVLWSDGSKVTSKDVATTFTLHCFKDTGSNKFSILKAITGCQDVFDGKATTVSGIKMLDSYTIQLTVGSQNPGFFFEMPNIVIIPDVVFSKIAPKDIISSDFVVKAPSLCAGPFCVKSFTPNEQIEFVANPKYYGGMPKLDTIVEKKIPDRNTRLLAFQKGEIDMIDDGLTTDFDTIMKLPGITAISYPSTIQALWINYHSDSPNKNDPKYVAMAKKEFHQALAYAIDFEGFRNIMTGGHPDLLVPRVCFWTNGISASGTCDPSLNQYKFDLAKAQSLLKSINWDPKWDVDFAPYGLTPGPEMEALQQMWTKAGISIKLRGLDPATFIAEGYEKGNFDISVLGLASNGNIADFYYRFRCGNIYNSQTCPACYNLVRYCNADFDKLVTQANTTSDPKVYEPLMLQLTKIWNDELPLIVYGQGKAFRLVGPKVDGKTIQVGNAYSWEDAQLWSLK